MPLGTYYTPKRKNGHCGSCVLHTVARAWPGVRLLSGRAVHDLADLPSRGVAAGTERVVAVAGDDSVVVCRLHEAIERVGAGHVGEVRAATGVDRPALG